MNAALDHATGASTVPAAVLEIRGLSKTFPGTVALDDVDFDVRDGEVHALVGQNGSGKSTLIKILAGYHKPDAGAKIRLCGDDLADDVIGSHDRLRFVHQDLGLFLELDAVDNLALRSEFLTERGGRIGWSRQIARTLELLNDFDIDFDVRQPLSTATPVQRTIVAIAAALAGLDGGSGLLVLDEPTAVLPPTEVRYLLDIVRRVRARGTSILYVSHRLDEIFEVADRVTILRSGRLVETRSTAEFDSSSLAAAMADSNVDAHYRADLPRNDHDPVVLTVEGIRGRYLAGIHLKLRRGEILGLAGLPGSGSTELPSALAGATSGVTGRISLGDGTSVAVERAKSLGLPIVPADRLRHGTVSEMSVRENLSLSVLRRLRVGRMLSRDKERTLIDQWTDRVQIVAADADASISTLSGGNQQKVVLARCLATDPNVLLLCEPTAGVDPATRQAIYELLAARAREGLSIIVTSSDIGDLLALCNRVLVMSNGAVVRELKSQDITETTLIQAMEETEQQ